MTIDSKLGETEVMCVLTSTNAASGWYISVFGDGEERRDEGVKGVKGKKEGRKGTVEVLAQRQWTVDDSGQFVCGNADHRLGVECLGRMGTMTARPVWQKVCTEYMQGRGASLFFPCPVEARPATASILLEVQYSFPRHGP